MRRGEAGREPAGGYEVRFRLEGSYRRYGWAFFAFGFVGFLGAIVAGEPWLFVFTGPAMGAGLFLIFRDPREYLIVEPRTRKLKLVRFFGRSVRVRREYALKPFVRLETAQYDCRPKGLRCMLLLFRADGSVEKVDDRLHDDLLLGICRDVAAEAGLEFVDRGRIDQAAASPDSDRLGGEAPVDRQQASGDEAAGLTAGQQ